MKGRYSPGVVKPNGLMPSCNGQDQQKILDVIATFRGQTKAAADALVKDLGQLELCRVLHAIRRWYTSQGWSSASKIIPHVKVLARAMDLRPPIGAYRGFKVDRNSHLANAKQGAEITLPVKLNGGCSSWTMSRELANRFSGASSEKVGIIVQLIDGAGVKTFIAPPERCKPWFNTLYARTMGRSHRHSEREYAIYAPTIRVRVVVVKK